MAIVPSSKGRATRTLLKKSAIQDPKAKHLFTVEIPFVGFKKINRFRKDRTDRYNSNSHSAIAILLFEKGTKIVLSDESLIEGGICKLRAEKAHVLAITDRVASKYFTGGISKHRSSYKYKVGEMQTVTKSEMFDMTFDEALQHS